MTDHTTSGELASISFLPMSHARPKQRIKCKTSPSTKIVVVTLINALRQRGLKKGVAALCIGGGEATALAIELP